MKKIFLSALLALGTLGSGQAANLYSSNLGNGVSLDGNLAGIASGTVRFGVFPDGFDFNANVGDFNALDAAFIQVASFSGDLSVSAINGFYQQAISYDSSISYEGTSYAAGIAGKKVYIWILNSVIPEEVSQQLIASSNQTWAAADAVVADTFASPDSGVAGLTFHVGSPGGADIGAGAASHVLGGAQTAVTEVTLAVAPAGVVNAGTAVTFTATTDGSPVKTFKWRKNGEVIPNQSASTLVLATSVAQDTGVYDVLVSNNLATDVPSNTVSLTVNTPKPTILTQPLSTVVAVGETLELNTEAVATGNLQFQWKKGANIAGATTNELVLPNMSLAQAGAYTVSVTNAPGAGTGTVVSSKAEVVVVDKAPAVVASAVGGNVSLTTLTAGKVQSYQWFKVGEVNALQNSTKYTGVTTKTLLVRTVQEADSGDYFCVITSGSDSENSGIRTLRVFTQAPELDAAAVALMPDAEIGSTYSFSVPVLGGAVKAPLTYAARGLPAGLKIDAKTGLITGRPTKAAQNISVTLTATNRAGSDSEIVVINVNASPELAGLAGNYVGPIDRNIESDLPGAALGGRFEMTVSTLGALTGKLYLGAVTLPVKGFLELNEEVPYAEFTVARTGGLTPLVVGFEIEGDNLVNGFISDTTNDVNFDGYRNVFSTKLNPADDYKGLYNFALGFEEGNANIADATVPQGAGFGSFTVAADGKLSIKGKTADGEAFTTASFVSPTGDVFLFQTLYKTVTKGSIHGRLIIDSDDDNLIEGTATQNRPFDISAKQRTYAAGFSITDPTDSYVIMGGLYTAPVSPLVLLNKAANTQVELSLTGGTDATAAEALVTLQAANKILVGTNTAKTKLAINAKTGLITGSFALTDKRAGKFEGVVIPDGSELVGLGYYLLPEATPTITTSKILSGLMSLDVPVAPPAPALD